MTQRMDTQGTAFVICDYRSRDPALSGDVYAHLWVTPQAIPWTEGFLSVSPCEVQAHCLRNRFFLDSLKRFLEDHPDGVLVNLGAGYSFYPHLLPEHHRYCDVDHPNVIAHKVSCIAEWEKSGQIPVRDVSYFSADLEDGAQLLILEQRLRAWIDGRPSFFLLEGVLFFLQAASLTPLFQMLARVQRPGDVLGTVSFVPETFTMPVYDRLLCFLSEHLGEHRRDYIALPISFYESLPGYRLLDWYDECQLSRHYSPDRPFEDPWSFLNEHLFLLQRIN